MVYIGRQNMAGLIQVTAGQKLALDGVSVLGRKG